MSWQAEIDAIAARRQKALAMCGHQSGQILTLVWPSGEFGALPVEGGVSAGHKSALEAAQNQDEQAQQRAELEA